MKSLLRSSIIALVVFGAIAGVSAKKANGGIVKTPGAPCSFCAVSR